MTRPELHALVDIVMDARDRTKQNIELYISDQIELWHNQLTVSIYLEEIHTFSDFTKAVQEYIKTLEK